MIDALLENVGKARQRDLLEGLGLNAKQFAYVTLHRPSNVDEPANLGTIMSELNRLSGELPIIFPMHPRTKKMLGQFGIPVRNSDRFRILEPIGYHDSLCLTEQARLVLTDSGGLQEESTYFRTPCLTLRPNTERPVTVTMGSNRLTAPDRLRGDIEKVLANGHKSGAVPSLWDGRAAERTLKEIIAASPH